MKKTLLIIVGSLFITMTASGQKLFLIGEHSYPCTETFTLQPNSDEYYINDLNVLFAKDGNKALLGVCTKTVDVLIRGKLIIYLEDGTVISLTDGGIFDYVDKIASAGYYLTIDDLNKLKSSNIFRIRYTLEDEYGDLGTFGGNFSASNSGRSSIDFPTIIAEFYR